LKKPRLLFSQSELFGLNKAGETGEIRSQKALVFAIHQNIIVHENHEQKLSLTH
jgi:hypothetical protein